MKTSKFFPLSLLGILVWEASCFSQALTLLQVRPALVSNTAAAAKPNGEERDVVANEFSGDGRVLSRRNALARAATLAALTAGGSSPWILRPPGASARTVSGPVSCAAATADADPERAALRRELLKSIASKAPNSEVYATIDAMKAVDPMKSQSAAVRESALDGEWQLLWYNTDDFSPLLKLPSPFRPDSYQYFGSVAAAEVGAGRVAQGLTGGVLGGSQLWLSSGAVSSPDDPSVIEIYPPFRFQTGKKLGVDPGSKNTIVESESDADFRAANARTSEAQLAPKNLYQQQYLEDYGRGSLRISTIISGDPVIVGEVFIHQKM